MNSSFLYPNKWYEIGIFFVFIIVCYYLAEKKSLREVENFEKIPNLFIKSNIILGIIIIYANNKERKEGKGGSWNLAVVNFMFQSILRPLNSTTKNTYFFISIYGWSCPPPPPLKKCP